MMFSAICLPLINPPWFLGIIEGRTSLILLEITLVMILYPMLQSEIGLNLSKEVAHFSLGINARKVELVLPPILLQTWDFITIL